MLQVPFCPLALRHFLLGFCLTLDGTQVPFPSQRAFLTQALVVPGIRCPQAFPLATNRQRLVQHSLVVSSHCSVPSLTPLPQRVVRVREDEAVRDPVPVPEGEPVPVGV
jgi:hypothetical protein